MRKIIAIMLTVTAIVVLFTSCKDNGDDTTQLPLSTSDTTTASTTESTTTTAPSTTGATYVLTTNQSKQAPWYTTTRFVPSPDATTTTAASQSAPSSSVTNMYEDITYPTSDGGAITPSVTAATSAAQTTVWSTHPSDSSTGDRSTTDSEDSTKKDSETTTTEEVKPEGKQVVINSTWLDGDGNFCAAIDSAGWGKIKSNSIRVPVYIDGVEADKPATLQISSSTDGDGNQYVFVNVAKYDVVEFGGTVSFTIPEGFLKNTSGTRYNYATDVSM